MVSWIDTYKNHILHSSVYVAVAASALKSSSAFSLSGGKSSTVTDILLWLAAGISTLCLASEVKYMIKRRGLPPGDSGLPIVGHLVDLIRDPMEMKLNRLKQQQLPEGSSSSSSSSPSAMIINLVMRPIVIFFEDDDIQWCLSQERKGNLVPTLVDHAKQLVGEESIMMQHSANHRRLRKAFEPSFSPAAVRSYAKAIDETTQQELARWCENDNEYCTSKEWSLLAMRLFFVCAFGDDAVDDSSLQRLSDLFETWVSGFRSALPVTKFIPGTQLYNAHVAKKRLADVLGEMVDEFKTKHPPGSDGVETSSMMGRLCYGVDDEGEPLPRSQLICNIQFILFAGHDTTKGSFSAFNYYLAKHPDIRTHLVKEVESFSEPLDPDELKAAPILNAFLAETWRLIPPVDSHNLKPTCDLEYKGYKIPVGAGVSLELQFNTLLNDDDDNNNNSSNNNKYPNPREFRIERWLPKDHPLHDPKYYVEGVDYNVMSVRYRAFNMGAHMCLGGHFAKLEARIVLTRLLQKYDMTVQNDTLVKFPLRQYDNDFKLCKRTTTTTTTDKQ